LEVDPQTEIIDVQYLSDTIKKTLYDWLPRTGIVVMENPTSNGIVLPIQNMKQVYEVA